MLLVLGLESVPPGAIALVVAVGGLFALCSMAQFSKPESTEPESPEVIPEVPKPQVWREPRTYTWLDPPHVDIEDDKT